MAQLSRPYQFGLLGVVLLAAVWLVLIQGHSSSSTTAGSGSSAPAVQTVTTSTAVPDKHAKAKIYKGSAPGVAGLTGAVAKAEGAVSTSQQNAKALEQKSAAASSEAAAGANSSTPQAAASAPTKAAGTTTTTHVTKVTPTKTTHVTTTKTTHFTATKTAPNASTRSTIAVNQRLVEAQLQKGKVAVILFWDPRGSDDVSVRKAVSQMSGNGRWKVAVNYARANQVASFGTITRGIQVYGTPTLLVVNKKGQTITLTGLQDSFAIEQAISEARHG
jgi:hypothetical protein